jgi:hypothetical protein
MAMGGFLVGYANRAKKQFASELTQPVRLTCLPVLLCLLFPVLGRAADSATEKGLTYRQDILTRWLQGKEISDALRHRSLEVIEECRLEDGRFPELLVGPIAALRAVEAVAEGSFPEKDLLTHGEVTEVAFQWRRAATKARASGSPWHSELLGREGGSKEWHRIVRTTEQDVGLGQPSVPTCVAAVAQLARSEWDPHYASALDANPVLAVVEQRWLHTSAGGKWPNKGAKGRGVDHALGASLLADLGKMYGVPVRGIYSGSWARRYLPVVLQLGFVVPFSVSFEVPEEGAHELLAFSYVTEGGVGFVAVADPASRRSMWIDIDALFTEPLFRLGNVFWKIKDFFVPDLAAVDLHPDCQIDPESRNRLEQAALEHKQKLGKPLSLAFPLRKRNGCVMQFVNGIVVAADEAPARVVPTGIHWMYASLGSVDSALGLPLTNEHIDDQGRAVVQFEHGTIFWKEGRGWVEWP